MATLRKVRKNVLQTFNCSQIAAYNGAKKILKYRLNFYVQLFLSVISIGLAPGDYSKAGINKEDHCSPTMPRQAKLIIITHVRL